MKVFKSLENRKRVRQRLKDANIYHACNGDYTMIKRLNRHLIMKSPYHSIKIDKENKIHVELDKDAPDFKDMFQSTGGAIPPDEILDFIKPSTIKIPVVDRSQLPELPDSDLLAALHYYTSRKLTKSSHAKRHIQSLDETALLALGMIVEDWVDEIVDENAAKLFTDKLVESTSKSEQLAHMVEFIEDEEDEGEENDNEDNDENDEDDDEDDSESENSTEEEDDEDEFDGDNSDD